jgi:hypothetical protein
MKLKLQAEIELPINLDLPKESVYEVAKGIAKSLDTGLKVINVTLSENERTITVVDTSADISLMYEYRKAVKQELRRLRNLKSDIQLIKGNKCKGCDK